MAQTEIDTMVTEITFEPLVVTATPPGQRGGAEDIERLRELLRPLISDLLEEELDLARRIAGR